MPDDPADAEIRKVLAELGITRVGGVLKVVATGKLLRYTQVMPMHFSRFPPKPRSHTTPDGFACCRAWASHVKKCGDPTPPSRQR